ncbi:type II toxin-antitoxin system HicB family antitoxin [Burkholderia multivorans]|uniref:type II toxin-antitoxin system HicB family antitoxin n=1 Tax=Burkholderia multivorans TaxID=87883 RepID=UPI001FC9A4AB|nr:type II toxin-antitoxin system HicB family antitoxin [Burkholderia multivorans]
MAGVDEADTCARTLAALEDAFEIYFGEKRPIPLPSAEHDGKYVVTLPVLLALKVLLANEMIEQKVRKAELARRLQVSQVQIDRLLRFRHASKIEHVEAAFTQLGKRLEIRAV